MNIELTPEATVLFLLAVGVTIVTDGTAEGDSEVGVVGTCPAIGDAVAGNERVVLDA